MQQSRYVLVWPDQPQKAVVGPTGAGGDSRRLNTASVTGTTGLSGASSGGEFSKGPQARLPLSPDDDGMTLTGPSRDRGARRQRTLLLDAAGSLVPVIGLVADVAAMLGAGLERLKLRVAALEK